MKHLFVLALIAVLSLASVSCSEGKRSAWRESGQSWSAGGRQFLRALGRSISGDGSPKEEWKATGRDLGEAGRDTADALGESIRPEDERKP